MFRLHHLLLLPLLLGVAVPSSAGEKKTRILLLGKKPDHPYGTHMYLHTCGMLARCLELTPNVETLVAEGWPKDPKQADDVDAIVVYATPAAEFLLEAPHRDQVHRLMKKGTGLVTLHWASSVHKKNFERLGPTWMSWLGGTWVSSVGLSGGKSNLKQLVPDHPICRGWKEFDIVDEYYLDPTLGKATALLQVKERKGKDVVVAWSYERPGGGRAFATTLGHFYKNFQDDSFRRMIVNGILWSARRDVPAAGAPVNLPEEALALPPKK